MFYYFKFSAYVRFFVKVMIKMNVNISNEFIFSDVYRSVNYTGSPAKMLAIQCSLHQKNEIQSLIIKIFSIEIVSTL